MKDSLGILNILISTASTEREIKVQYRRLARIYHPEKYDSTTNKMSTPKSQLSSSQRGAKTNANGAPHCKTTTRTSPRTYASLYQAQQKMDYSPLGYT